MDLVEVPLKLEAQGAVVYKILGFKLSKTNGPKNRTNRNHFDLRFHPRKLPVVLPHKLIPWMLENGIYPEDTLDLDDVSNHWDHLASHLDWASEHVQQHGRHHIPLYLWGDDAQYNEEGGKLVTVAMGAVLDNRTSAVATVWPLFCYRLETWTQ